jgi:hypothetical protein
MPTAAPRPLTHQLSSLITSDQLDLLLQRHAL